MSGGRAVALLAVALGLFGAGLAVAGPAEAASRWAGREEAQPRPAVRGVRSRS